MLFRSSLSTTTGEEEGKREIFRSINLRGQLIPIIDLRTRFGMARITATKSTRIIVTEIGTKKVGIVVDSVSEVLNIPLENVEDAPEMISGVGTEYIQGVGKMGDRLIIMLDLTMVITSEEKKELDVVEAQAAS